MNPDLIPREAVEAALRLNLPFFGIACVVLVIGMASLILASVRAWDRLLLWLGSFSVLYAVRLVSENDLVHAAMNVHGQEMGPWIRCLTYVIPIPYALFANELFGPGWKRSVAIWRWVEIAFAALAIPSVLFSSVFGGQVLPAESMNGILIISGTVLILLHVLVWHGGSDSLVKSLKWPLIVFGALVVLTNGGFRPGGVDVEPVGFLVLLAGLGVTAVRHTMASERKLIDVEQELATARRIQSSIIPQSAPVLPSVSLATRYQPMTSVAGDFYDFLQTGETCLTILVADVSGHGVPAALVASMLKVCFAAQRENSQNPADVLAGLNRMLRGSLGGQYVTAACAAIDAETRTITYAGAGHPASLLLRSTAGKVEQLSENGLFIGPFPTATYSNISVSFQSGDKLLLYTDGITEAIGPDGEEFGREGLERFLLESVGLETSELVEQLFRKIRTPQQQDDLTVVLAQFT